MKRVSLIFLVKSNTKIFTVVIIIILWSKHTTKRAFTPKNSWMKCPGQVILSLWTVWLVIGSRILATGKWVFVESWFESPIIMFSLWWKRTVTHSLLIEDDFIQKTKWKLQSIWCCLQEERDLWGNTWQMKLVQISWIWIKLSHYHHLNKAAWTVYQVVTVVSEEHRDTFCSKPSDESMSKYLKQKGCKKQWGPNERRI